MKRILCTDPAKRFTAEDIRTHPWFSHITEKSVQKGIIIGINEIPIYPMILDLLEKFRFNPKDAERYIKANKHNHITTTYYLLLKRYERLGKSLDLPKQATSKPP